MLNSLKLKNATHDNVDIARMFDVRAGIRFCLTMLVALACVPRPSRALPDAETTVQGLHIGSCTVGKAQIPAECGVFGVFENRRSQKGRIIGLHLVLLKASRPSQHVIAFLAGGPGQSATGFAESVADGQFAKALSALRADYNILFVDNRGMGSSNPFKCDFTPVSDPSVYFLQLWPDTLVSACRVASSSSHDLAQYNTSNAVDDLDDIRSSLHYEKLILYGASDGTFFSLVYMRRHPESVDAAVLIGVAPPGFQPLPGAPEGAQKALDDLVRDCKRDAACNAHFPNFASHFYAVLRRFNIGLVAMKIRSPNTHEWQIARLSKEVFVDELRQVLDDPNNAAYIPYIIEKAYGGEYTPLSELISAVSLGLAHALNWGAFLSYSCSDWIPFVSSSEMTAAAKGSFATNLRYLAQRRACSIWNVPAMPPSFNSPVHSDVPVLMISGSDDPATPPHYAREELPYLPNGKLIIVQGAGHAAELPCTDRLVVQFVRQRSARSLPTSLCRGSFRRPPFATSD